MTNHTPGPWVLRRATSPIHHEFSISDKSGEFFVSWTPYKWPVMSNKAKSIEIANARLIAAAPDLLELLQKIVNHADAGTAEIYSPLVEEARAVITKVNGKKK